MQFSRAQTPELISLKIDPQGDAIFEKTMLEKQPIFQHMNEGVVSKETMVLRRWGSSIQKFGFINGVDDVNWPPYRDSKS